MESTFNKYTHRFSVFTATFNRASYLRYLYKNLCQQTFKDFEWVVVNDGSSDNTDEVMFELIKENILDIRYFKLKKNSGKHIAWREGIKNFRGRYVIGADDDDPISPDALEVHNRYWTQLEHDPNYNEFWEVKSRCQDTNGKLIGPSLTLPYLDSDYIEINIKNNIKSEMVGSRKVEVLKKEASVPTFIFEDKCSNFAENIRWIRAARKYKTRFVPEITRTYMPGTSGLVNTGTSSKGLYNTLVQAIYMVWENRDLLLRYSLKNYFRYLLVTGAYLSKTKEVIKFNGGYKLYESFIISFSKTIYTRFYNKQR